MSIYEMIKGILYQWKTYDLSIEEQQEIQSLALNLNVSLPLATILYNRGLKTKQQVYSFLFPDYDLQRYHASHLKDSMKARDRIIQAIENKEKILIAGDYDVDGITSTSLMVTALIECGAEVNFFLPHRVKDGYGLAKKTIALAKKSGYTLVITVDNGISAFEALEYAKEINLDVIVTDHHQPPEILSTGAYCIVNPHQKDCEYPFKELAGVGVAFKMAQLLYEYYQKPLSHKVYELFVLGTIADVVPLVEENRYWITRILKMLDKQHSYALSILKQNSKMKVDKHLSSTDIAFSCAPQLNALGRLEDPRQGVYFLISDDNHEIEEIGTHLLSLNQKRRSLERDATSQLQKELEEEKYNPQEYGCIVRASKEYTPGIIGLIAARMCQTYGVPACIFAENAEGILKGSCRSIPECNIIECLSEVPTSLLLSFGGHAGAAGLSLKKENLEKFFDTLSQAVKKRCSTEDLQQKITIETSLEIDDLNNKLWHDLLLLEPYGASNQTPLVCIKNVTIKDVTLLKEAHVKITVQKESFSSSVIFFNRPEFYTFLHNHLHEPVHIAGKITNNTWNNKSRIEIIGQDIAL